MTRALLVAVALLSSDCAARTASARTRPPTVTQYTFTENLPPETRVCVPRNPFASDLSCMPLDELRQWLRRRRLAHFAPDTDGGVPFDGWADR